MLFSLPTPPPATCANAVALQLLSHTRLPLDAPLLDLGAGASSFLDVLLEQGYSNLLAVDVSAGAVAAHAQQFTTAQNEHVLWLVDDVTQAQQLPALGPVQLWHDRAMLRVLTLPLHQTAYLRMLDEMTLPGWSYVLLSVCLPGGATQQGDLRVHPYDLEQLATFLGAAYVLEQHYPYQELFADGTEQPCLYTLFRRATRV